MARGQGAARQSAPTVEAGRRVHPHHPGPDLAWGVPGVGGLQRPWCIRVPGLRPGPESSSNRLLEQALRGNTYARGAHQVRRGLLRAHHLTNACPPGQHPHVAARTRDLCATAGPFPTLERLFAFPSPLSASRPRGGRAVSGGPVSPLSSSRRTPRPQDLPSDTLCRCGHPLAEHRATTIRPCLHGADELGRKLGAPGECPCERFRAAAGRAGRGS